MAERDTDDPLERRRRQREAKRRRNLSILIVGGGLVIAGLVVVVAVLARGSAVPGITAPSQSNEGESWTHKDLADHLGRKGLKVDVKASAPLLGSNDPTSLFVPVTGDGIGVILTTSPKAARERANSLGGQSFSWGRFVVVGNNNPDLYARVKAVLHP